MISKKENKRVQFVAATEQDEIDRKMLIWVNTFPYIPSRVSVINYENLAADNVGMAISLIPGARVIRRDILGGYTAEYTFNLIYRIKPGNSNDKRLSADELLNKFGDWVADQRPDIGEGLRVIKIEPMERALTSVPYENGDEDHYIPIKMTYERSY